MNKKEMVFDIFKTFAKGYSFVFCVSSAMILGLALLKANYLLQFLGYTLIVYLACEVLYFLTARGIRYVVSKLYKEK